MNCHFQDGFECLLLVAVNATLAESDLPTKCPYIGSAGSCKIRKEATSKAPKLLHLCSVCHRPDDVSEVCECD